MTALKIILLLLWLYLNIYLFRNRKAVAKFLRGYGAYEVWKMKEWVKQWNDYELTDINDTCLVYRLREDNECSMLSATTVKSVIPCTK